MATDATPSTAAAAAAVATASSAASAGAMEAVAMRAGDAFWGPPAAAARAAARGVPAASGRTLALDRRGGRGAGALAPSVRRAACPPRRQQCKCRRLPVAQALAAATVVVEVLVVSCVRGGYRVRANQVLHGCPIRFSVIGVGNKGLVKLSITRECPPPLVIGRTYLLGLTGGRDGALGGRASGCGLVVDVAGAPAAAAVVTRRAQPLCKCKRSTGLRTTR